MPLLAVIWLACIVLACQLHLIMSGHPRLPFPEILMVLSGPMRPAIFLMIFPAFIPALLLSFWLTNWLVYAIRPARLALNLETADYPMTSFDRVQNSYLRWIILSAVLAILLATTGSLFL